MLMAHGVMYENAEALTDGWGTENRCGLLRKVLRATTKVGGGFQVT